MRRRQIRAIFFDIDGTLRDFDTKRVPDSTKEALRKAKEAGILLFVATGRHKLEIEEENLLEDMEFDGYVTLNGQYCYCGSTVVYDAPIDGAGVAAMLRLIGKDPFPCLFMEADRMYINMVDEVIKKAQEGIGTRIPPVMDVSRAAGQPIYQIVPYIGRNREEEIRRAVPGCEIIRWHDEYAVDVIPRGGSKCIGITRMAAHFGLSLEETAAVGDGANDVSMVEMAGLGIAMGNGKDAVKAVADYITDSIETDGLSRAVFYILENNHQEE